ncbi:Fur-regulated basic protein FbpA [Bacillus sp. RIT 809]|uniref:Fur-regulated basic protein FbpA n=1 Tax=Bacillus sp. RIT 809 TaxID=2803857 RepID=UPI0019512079|nr:Fur-regulated basic protein FbpA [Bacillus sp. RIT 809]MBM6649046.1 Fur-regulated basic protein FbpA [Bacillus sp. RIT 809]
MNKKRIYIEVLLHKGIYKEEKTGRQLYEMDELELFELIKGDGENEVSQKHSNNEKFI